MRGNLERINACAEWRREGTALVVVGSICGFGGAMALRRAFSGYNETVGEGFHPTCR
jgi:hypothetical protein